MKIITLFIALLITAICLDFAIRVVRFALTGRGRGKDFKFAWWRKES